MLNIKEKEIIEKLIKVTKSIEKLYSNLATLEIKNKKESVEFNKHLDYLNMALELERELYNSLNLDASKSIDIYNFLKISDKDSFLLREEELIVQNDYESLSFRRIVNRLLPTVINESSYDIEKITEELVSKSKEVTTNEQLKNLINSFEKRGYEVVQEKTKEGIILKLKLGINPDIEQFFKENNVLNLDISIDPIQDAKLKTIIDRDFYSGYIKFLEEDINVSKDKLKENLINSKYNTIFLKEELEEEFKLNKFNIGKDIVLSSESTATQIYDIDLINYKLYKDSLLNLMFNRQVMAMYTMNDDEFKSTLRNAMVKTIITLSEDKEELANKIYLYYDGQKKNNNREKVFNLLSDGFDKAKETDSIKVKIKV